MSELNALLVRFVVAIEIIAAAMSGGKAPATDPKENSTAKKTTTRKTSKVEEEPEDEEEPEEKAPAKSSTRKTTTTRKTSTAKKPPVEDEEEGDAELDELRDEISQMAKHIAKGDSDECADKYEALMDDYGVRTVSKLKDGDVEDFHKALKKLVEKYYDVE